MRVPKLLGLADVRVAREVHNGLPHGFKTTFGIILDTMLATACFRC